MGHSLSSRRRSKNGSPSNPQTATAKATTADTETSSATQESVKQQQQPARGESIVMATTTSAGAASNPNPRPLEGKVFGITGGASGIGLATAKLLAQRGAVPCIADIDPDAMEATRSYFAAQAVPFMISTVDVSQREQVDAWVEAIVREHGRLDGACNSAGVIGKSHGVHAVRDLEDSEWHKIIGVNLTGTMYCLRAQLRSIVDRGSIVNITSIHGVKGFARHASYDASKHGIIALSKAAALENGDREVRVNCVAPGSIYTALMQKEWDFRGISKDDPFKEPTAFRRHGTVEETANVICFLLGPESSFVSGSVYGVDGAWE